MDAETDIEVWEPIPLPKRVSPFYSLQSIAFCRVSAVGTVTGKTETLVARASGAYGEISNAKTPSLPLSTEAHGACSGGEQAHSGIAVALEKRNAALAEYRKVEEQLQQARQRLRLERRSRLLMESQIGPLRERIAQTSVKTKAEQQRTHQQQLELRELRRLLRGPHDPLDPHSHGNHVVERAIGGKVLVCDDVVGGAINPPHAGGSTCIEASNQLALTRGSGSTAAAKLPRTDSYEEFERDSTCTEEIQTSELGPDSKQERQTGTSGTAANATAAHTKVSPEDYNIPGLSSTKVGRIWRPEDCAEPVDPDQKAEIDMVRGPGDASLVRLRHPSGSAAIVDVVSARVVGWHTSTKLSPSAGLPALLPGTCAQAPTWRIEQLDYSSNEPFATLRADVEGRACEVADNRVEVQPRAVPRWCIRRTFVLGAEWLCEAVSIENLATAECILSVVEDRSDENCAKAVALADFVSKDPVEAQGVRLVVRRPPGTRGKDAGVVPPGARWTDARWWLCARVDDGPAF